MSRYIDAEYVKAVMINDRLMQGNAEFNLYAQQVEIQINAMPTIELVRCKECKYKQHCRKAVEHITHEPTSVTIGYKTVEWCSCGERE